uniref:Flp pilus assembly protein TadD, contains TPR repeats n=1 Tax=Candidatus Kentrum sp. MB TaxID=2138164 RepID=A0A450XFY3_9GAMM|nr:MAG: Flp pilus assembly protein TadD, contains TPR repeats [Candidatus Kentron sp. MB]
MEWTILEVVGVTVAAIAALAAVVTVIITKWPDQRPEQDPAAIAREVASATARELATVFVAAQEQQGKSADTQPPPSDALAEKDQRIRELTQAVETLRNTDTASEAQRKDAEAALAQGDTAKADAIFARMEQAGSDQAARAAKARGAIAYMNQPREALQHYQRAVVFAPEDAKAWNRIGVLNLRLGELAEAETAFQRTRELGQIAGDKATVAKALGNLGIIASTRGDLDKAEKLHRRALALNEELSHKEGMATTLGNLGVIAKTRGELDEAERLYQRALALHEELGHKEGMAAAFSNLGVLFETRGQRTEAEGYWRRALALYTEVGMKPQIEKTKGLLRGLGVEP